MMAEEKVGDADEEQAVVPLSEITVPRPVEPTDVQPESGDAPLYDTRGGGDAIAGLVAKPPAEREPSPPSPAQRVQLQQASPRRPSSELRSLSNLATRLYTVSYLIFFAILGTLARLGLQALTFYPGAPIVTGVLWANFGGSVLMGFFIEDRNIFLEEWGHPTQPSKQSGDPAWIKRHKTVKKSIPLYIGLTTGFCGSFTSFSSFMRDAFLALSNDLAVPSASLAEIQHRNRGDSFMAVVAVLILTVSLSISGLSFGAHIALALDPWIPTVPFRVTRNILDRLVVVLGWGCWLGAVLMSIWPPEDSWRGQAVFALVFAPPGCLFRFYASLLLNPRIPHFPLGTFVANIFGTAIMGMCYDLQHVANIGALPASPWQIDPSSPRLSLFGTDWLSSLVVSCQVLQGVMDGFCGCATTVSTWVAELTSLGRRRFAYIYGGLSMAVGLGLLVAVMGSVKWSRGFDSPFCIT